MTGNHIFILSVLLAVALIVLMIIAVFRAQDNEVECWQLIASRNRDGRERADIDKIGKVVALIIVTLCVTYYTYQTPLGGDVLALIAIYLTYAGGVSMYSVHQRSRRGDESPRNDSDKTIERT